MDTPTPWSELPEDEQVELWNLDQFDRQGFDGLQIATLLEWNVDPHETEDLIGRGCSTEHAMRIVRPLDAAPPHPGFSVRV